MRTESQKYGRERGEVSKSSDNTLIIGAAVGSGISALAAEDGGADFLLAINAARFRNMGAPSIACMLPTHDANALGVEFAANEILPRTKLPVLIGVNCWAAKSDPAELARHIGTLGFAGAVNFPSAMHYSKEMRQILDTGQIGPKQEVLVPKAAQDQGLKTLYYCGTRGQAQFAAKAGLRDILFNYGWNVGGALGHTPRISLEESAVMARDIGLMIKQINPRINFFLEGGPILTSDDLGFVASSAPLDGYVGGSTLDRLPFESSVANRIAGYKSAKTIQRRFEEDDEKLLNWARAYGFVGQSPALVDYLRRLRALVQSGRPFATTLDRGSDEAPIVAALRGATRKSTLLIDPSHVDTPMQATRQLFGAFVNGVTTFGALVRPEVGQIILRNPHLLSAPVQRRLATALNTGAIPHPANRALQPFSARLVLLMPDRLESDAAMEPALRETIAGWSVGYPALRERAEDIGAIIEDAFGTLDIARSTIPIISASADQVFRGHGWPGNEQEVAEVVGTLIQTHPGETVERSDARALVARSQLKAEGATTISWERQSVADALRRNGFHKGNTAEALGMSRKTLYNKLRKFGLN